MADITMPQLGETVTEGTITRWAKQVGDQVAEDDKVVTRWSATGTHTGDFAGVPATGRPVAVSGIHIHRVRHGRLIEHWEELNLLGLLRQLGALS